MTTGRIEMVGLWRFGVGGGSGRGARRVESTDDYRNRENNATRYVELATTARNI